MRFGVFFQLPVMPGQTAAGRYQETVAQIQHADQLGFETVWLAEGHFRPAFSELPAPLLLAANLAGLTRRIRLGTASVQLPLHHPLTIIEQASMVDVLSGGRLDLGIGRGGSAPLSAALGQAWPTRDERFDEQLEIIRRAWTEPATAYRGQHYQFEELTVYPRPLQQPAPPVHITANHPDMATFTGAQGLGLLMGVAIHHFPDAYAAHVERYRRAFVATDWQPRESRAGAVFWAFVGRDLADLRARIGPLVAHNHLVGGRSFDELARAFGIYGSAAECVERIAAIQRAARLDEIICHFNPGGLIPHAQVLEAMTRFAEEVRPHCE